MSAERNLNDTELLSAYLDGQLTIDERSALEARLQHETDLRRQLALLRATVDLIRELPQLAAPRDFTLTRQMLSAGRTNRRVYTFSLLSAAAAVVLLFVGFGLLTMRTQSAVSRTMSQIGNNLEPDVVSSQIALLPTQTAISTQSRPTSSAEPGFFAQEDQTLRGADLESESAGEQAQPTQISLSQMMMTSTAPAGAIQVAPPMAEAADELDDATTSTTEEETAEDGRLRDTQQAQSEDESLPAPAFPSDAMAQQPSQEGAGGMLAFQATTAPPTSTIRPTLLPTRTSLPTETASNTPSRTPTQTNTATATITPSPPPPDPTVRAEPTDMLALVLIAAAVILLLAAISAVIIHRQR
jgi:hypothetical protein